MAAAGRGPKAIRYPPRAVRPRIPDYEAFATRAQEIAKRIPAEFLEGVEDVVVHRAAKRHPLLEGVVTLGECEPSPLAAMAGEGPGRSIVHVYYGSFVDQAKDDPRFDVDAELVETIEHEVRHHVEDRAGVRALIDEDDLFDAHARFLQGLEVPAGWYRRGERLAPDVYAVELDLFVELRLRRPEWERLKGTVFETTVLNEPLEAEIPADAEPGKALTFEGEGLAGEEREEEKGHGEEEDPEVGDLHLIPVVH